MAKVYINGQEVDISKDPKTGKITRTTGAVTNKSSGLYYDTPASSVPKDKDTKEITTTPAPPTQNKYPDGGDSYVSGSDTSTFLKYPYGVRLQGDPSEAFRCIRDYEKFVLDGDDYEGTAAEYADILSNNNGEDSSINVNGISTEAPEVSFFSNPDYTDSRVGCNDAINPYWQFNRDDDIRPTMFFPASYVAGQTIGNSTDDATNGITHACGMGRVYAETYDDNQQILWIEAGVPRFMNLLEFYRDAADNDVAEALNAGTLSGMAIKTVTKLLKGAIWAISLPVLAPFYLSRWVDMLACDRVTKYYSFQPAMTMYYETVNTMLQYVAIGMGIHPYSLEQHEPDKGSTKVNGASIIRSYDMKGGKTETVTRTKKVKRSRYNENGEIEYYYETEEVEEERQTGTDYDAYPGIPDVLKHGPDIFRIMNRRAQMIDMSVAELETRDLLQMDANGENNGNEYFLPSERTATYKDDHWAITDAAKNWFGALKGSVLGSGNHIGFKVERGVDASESFSNSTGQTGIAQKLNGISEKYKEENESYGNSAAERIATKGLEGAAGGAGVAGAIDQVWTEIKKGALSTVADFTGFDIGAVLISGNGFLDIPEVWRSSSFSKSYSINIQLRSRYGDPVSIFQSIYIPMLMLMALSAPRAIGTNMYTSPFIIRAFCRGMFTVPLGIVESLTINRGRDEFGWSNGFLPTCVNVTLQIKDLSPTLFLSMQDNGIFDTFTRNGNLLEYLDTLSALGLKERCFYWPKLMRKLKTTLAVARTTIFSSTYWGQRIGRSNTGRAINQLMVPFKNDRTPNN